MCGISGIVNLNGETVAMDAVHRMVTSLRHRGPDEAGFYQGGHVGFGHARLSIIDLAGGQQPMCNQRETLCITFNGEIFNYVELRAELTRKGHRFRTQSDTEVILRLYEEEGENCVQRLNGQWAFAIWDATQRQLFLSRDRLGVRPLFYTRTRDKFLFASEIKALFAGSALEPALDLISLAQIFTLWVTVPERTAFKGIWQLPPAHSLVLKDGHARLWKYWNLEYEPDAQVSPEMERQRIEELNELLFDAARIRLRSDVPVGTYLSGGLDSSLITAITCSLAGERVRSFGVTFDEPAFDESAHQEQASQALHVQHAEVRCSREAVADIFPLVVHHTEQPIVRTAPAPLCLLSEQVRANGYKVVLTGEGADEVFGGYDIFKEAKVRRFWGSHPQSRWRPLLLRKLYPHMAAIQSQPDVYLRHFFRVEADDLADPFFSHLPRWQLTGKLTAFFSEDVKQALRDYDPLDEVRQALPSDYWQWPPFCQAQYLETQYLLPGYILSAQGDRMAMTHSVECRYPFLDHRVVEFAGRLHPSLKMRAMNEKYLLKRIARGKLPTSIVKRHKQPYRAPDAECFFPSQRVPYADELLSVHKVKDFGVFDGGRVSRLVAKAQSGQSIGIGDNMAVVGILSTQLLMEQFIHSHARECSC